MAEAARDAIRAASDAADGTPMLHDDDFYLDQEGPGGDMDLAAATMVEVLAEWGFTAEIVPMMVCPTCEDGPMREWCLTCRSHGYTVQGTPPAQDRGSI